MPGVESVSPAFAFYPSDTYPNDIYFNAPNYYQWGLYNYYAPGKDIHAVQAWDINKGRSDVKIAVVDGGVDYNHPDLDPGNRSRIINGYDFGEDDNDPMDDIPEGSNTWGNHGTPVAGIIGAITNNNSGVAGIMWNCSIMPVKVANNSGWGPFGWGAGSAFDWDIADGIDYARSNGASVINMSFGGEGNGFWENLIIGNPIGEATYNAYLQGVVLVAAMGNNDNNTVNYPAGYPWVIAVGATNENDQRVTGVSWGSNYGSHIDVSAPGISEYSVRRNQSFGNFGGTSCAAPMVSGVAGLIISQAQDRGINFTNDDVKHLLEVSADDQGDPGWDQYYGYGRINARKALELLSAPYTVTTQTVYNSSGILVWDSHSHQFYNNAGLASGNYYGVKTYKISGHVTFSVPYSETPYVWVRDRDCIGWDYANPNLELPWVKITNVTTTGFDYETVIYWIGSDASGQQINKYWPGNSNSLQAKITYTVLGISAVVTGPITSNTTWSGNVYVVGDVTVNSGVTLTINTGTNITFQNNSSLIVNGILSANSTSYNGITFDFISPSGSNGIKFNSGSENSVINQCVIKNASRGVECNGILPTIQNSTFTNNSTSIWLNNIGIATRQIYNNSIQYNSAHGIALYYSSPHIAKNYIFGNNNGIFALGSSPYIYDNYLMNNSYGVYLVSQSSPNITGYSGYYANALVGNSTAIYADGQCNAYINGNNVDIYNNYAIRANNPNVVVATNNWWGMYPPNPNYFYATNGAQIYYLPAAASPFPNNYYPQLGKRSAVLVDNINTEHNNSEPSEFSLNEKLAEAILLKTEGKYEDAVSIYIKEFRRDKNIERRKYILSQIADCYKILGKDDFIDLLDNETKSSLSNDNELYALVLELENIFLINNRKYDTAIKNLVTLKEDYSQYENVEKNALFNLGYIYSELLKDKLNSRIYFSELKEKYPEDILTYNAMLITGEIKAIPEILPKGKISDNKHKSEIIEMYNYPNPFNPTTVISYQIQERNMVTIKVYDILGKEVATLVNEYQDAGSYKVEFSADEYQLSSGVYFYTLKAGKNYVVKKMLLAK